MPKQSSMTRAMNRAHGSLLKSFDILLERHPLPLGHDAIDPRTMAKEQSALIFRGTVPSLPMDSNYVQQRKRPDRSLPQDKGQNPRIAAGGKPVDPTAIETAQAAEGTTVDQSGAVGTTDIPFPSN